MLTVHALIASGSTQKWRSTAPKRALPVVAVGPVALVLQVTLDGEKLDAEDVLDAPATRHLVHTLRQRADALNVQNVSDAYLHDGAVQVELSPVLFAEVPRVHVELRSLRLSYLWTTTLHADCHPWNAQHALLLPLREQLDALHNSSMQKYLLGSYPYVFGPWRKAFEAEKSAMDVLARSVARIVARSPNAGFTDAALDTLRRLKAQNEYAEGVAIDALGKTLNKTAAKKLSARDDATKDDNMEAIKTALRALYARRVRYTTLNCMRTPHSANKNERADSPTLMLVPEDDFEDNADAEAFATFTDDEDGYSYSRDGRFDDIMDDEGLDLFDDVNDPLLLPDDYCDVDVPMIIDDSHELSDGSQTLSSDSGFDSPSLHSSAIARPSLLEHHSGSDYDHGFADDADADSPFELDLDLERVDYAEVTTVPTSDSDAESHWPVYAHDFSASGRSVGSVDSIRDQACYAATGTSPDDIGTSAARPLGSSSCSDLLLVDFGFDAYLDDHSYSDVDMHETADRASHAVNAIPQVS
ncbi:hypothetical protein EXIGLDRAFT_829942, partial [Exidia glandulosa HHB12029]